MTFQGRQKDWVSAALAAFFCSLAVVVLMSLAQKITGDWQNKVLDAQFKLRAPLPVDDRIVLIDIDDSSIESIGRWPWDRGLHAEMIDILSRSGAAVIGYDILFKQSSEGRGDKALIAAMSEAGNVILPTGFEFEMQSVSQNSSLLQVRREVGPSPAFVEAAAGLGHISSSRDADGVIRRVPLLVDQEGRPFPALSISLLAAYADISPETFFERKEGEILLKGIKGNDPKATEITIPTDAQALMRINYAGKWVDTFSHFSFVDVLTAGEIPEEQPALRNGLQGKIVIVSNTATGYDLKPIPLESDYPGGGIHANILNTILSRNFLVPLRPAASFLVIFLLSLLTVMIGLSRPIVLRLSLVVLPIAIYLYAAGAFFSQGIILPILSPLVAVPLTCMTLLFFKNVSSRRLLIQVEQEKAQAGIALQGVRKNLEVNQEALEKKCSAFSEVMLKMRGAKDSKEKALKQLSLLRADLEAANEERTALLKTQTMLQEKNDHFFLAEDLRQSPILEASWESLRQEARRHRIVTQSRKMLAVFKRVKKVAATKESVLIFGETGTGKELIAQAMHRLSKRSSNNSLVSVNMAAIPESLFESTLFGYKKGAFSGAVRDRDGKFQEADGGTIFLDEIGELPLQLQAKLLRVLENGEVDRVGATKPERVDVRVVAASNQNLKQQVRQKKFREDLFFRLNVLTIDLPPLRDRQEDLQALVAYLIQSICTESGVKTKSISRGALREIASKAWPGNIRELRAALVRSVVFSEGDTITEADLELGQDDSETVREQDAILSMKAARALEETLDLDKDLSDPDFLALLRTHRFSLKETALELEMAYGAVGARFKGLSLKILNEQGLDFNKTAVLISEGGRDTEKVAEKIKAYHQNLVKAVADCENSEEAMLQKAPGLFRNVKKKYHASIESLIRKYFEKEL